MDNAYWIRGAPLIDRVTASPAPGGDEMELEAEADESVWEHLAGEGEVVMDQGDAANQLADFLDRLYAAASPWQRQLCYGGRPTCYLPCGAGG